MTTVLGLDLGGTLVKAGLVRADGTVSRRTVVPSAERAGLVPWVEAARNAVRDVLAEGPPAPTAIGVAMPGAVDPRRRLLVDLVGRLPEGAGTDVAALFAEFGLPVAADNDARAALEAERRWGAAVGAGDVVLFTIGTGLGGAAVVCGRLPGGEPILAGNQLGHLGIDLDGPRCVCGNVGCAEVYASASGLVRMAGERGLEVSGAQEVLDNARAGESRAVAVVSRFTAALAAAVVNVVHAYQPELVVLGGGVAAGSDVFLPAVRELVSERAWTVPGRRVRITVSALGDDLGVLAGAAAAFRDLDPTKHA